MVSNPGHGMAVRFVYRPGLRPVSGLHGRAGVVVIPCKSPKARNHGVLVDGRIVVVPRGHLAPAS